MSTMMTIPFGRPWITDEDRAAVMDVLRGNVLTHGPQCKDFEKEFGEFIGPGAHCVSMSSCMGALHMAYFHFRIGPGDEVIAPAMTHVATVHAIELVGARPVFVDVDPHTGNIKADAIERAITPKTKAITLVHFLGIPCEMDQILDIARRHNLKVIEDCAIAVGARYRGTHVGMLGDLGCFSFYPVKHITTGEGGMIISRHADVAQGIARQRAFGVDRTHTERKVPGYYDVVELGLNYRMSEMQAALGRGQIKKLPEILRRRTENFTALKKGLTNVKDLLVLDAPGAHAVNSFYCMSVVFTGALAARRNELIAKLNERGVGTSIYYPQPVPRMTYYRTKYGYDARQFPQAERIADGSIALPVGPHLGLDEMQYIVKEVKSAVAGPDASQ